MHPLHRLDGDRLHVAGLVTAHSHAFQLALRGNTQRAPTETGTFWSWREAMYRLATSLTPESIERDLGAGLRELRRAGVTTVGEFHYVHHQPDGTPYAQRTLLADVVVQAALDAGCASRSCARPTRAPARGGPRSPGSGASATPTSTTCSATSTTCARAGRTSPGCAWASRRTP
jgi:cytosine/adenosine deaminase-related metal-dependent hydrolase